MEDLVFETTPHPVYNDFPMDLYFAEKVREIVKDYGITSFVETGVDKASTALSVAKCTHKGTLRLFFRRSCAPKINSDIFGCPQLGFCANELGKNHHI